MKWDISYNAEGKFILVVTQGALTVESTNEMVKDVNSAIEENQCLYVLIDHRKIVLKMAYADIYDRPKTLEQLEVTRGARIVEIVPTEYLEQFRFFETVSANRGFHIKIFTEENPAREWLKHARSREA